MNFLMWSIPGGIIGWPASRLTGTNSQQGLVPNVVVGIDTINQNTFTLSAMLVSFVGAAILLAIVNLGRRGSAR